MDYPSLFLTLILCSVLILSGCVKINVSNCFNKHLASQEGWSRSIPFEMSAYSDDKPNIRLTWEVYKINRQHKHIKVGIPYKYSKGNNFVIHPYSLHSGLYKIAVSHSDPDELELEKHCFLQIRSEPSNAVIKGGSSVNYRPKDLIVVDGSLSRDYCYPEGKENSLNYMWSCRQKNGRLCRGSVNLFTYNEKLVIPKKIVTEGEEFYITLTIKNEDNYTSSTTQNIFVKRNVAHFEITCLTNCPPWSSVGFNTTFTVSCAQHCGDPCTSVWIVFREGAVNINPGEKITCNDDAVCTFCATSPGSLKFDYSCYGKNVNGSATIDINFNESPQLACDIYPRQGGAYSTEFEVSCKVDSNDTIQIIDIYEMDGKNRGDFITMWSPPARHKFGLPMSTKKIYVRASFHPDVYTYTELYVNVMRELFLSDKEEAMNKIVDLYMDSGNASIKHFLETHHDTNKVLNMISSLWEEIGIIHVADDNDQDFDDFIHNMLLYTIDDLLSIPITTPNTLTEMNNAIKHLLINYHDAEPVAEKSLSMLCKKFATDYENIMNHQDREHFPFTMGISGITNTLAECVDRAVIEDESLLNLRHKKRNSTSSDRESVIQIITEHYDEYENFGDEYYLNLEELEEAGSNVLDVAWVLTKATVKSLGMSGERNFVSKNLNISVYKKPGHYFCKSVGTGGVNVRASSDISKLPNDIAFKLLTWKRNIFWWSPSNFKPRTAIIDISFEEAGTEELISDFEDPIEIIFDILKHRHPLHGLFSVTVPRNSKDYNDDTITIHRIDIFKHHGLCVHFFNLKGQKFKIIVKNFGIPTLEDFEGEDVIVIDDNNTYSTHENLNDYDSWFYVGVLPHEDMVRNSGEQLTFEYSVSFLGPVCYQWTFDETWQKTCTSGGGTMAQIVCKCNHLSVLAGTIDQLSSVVVKSMDIELEVTMESRRIIFWCILILFCLFSVLLLYGNKKHEIYYAADNNYNHRYAYLIVVRTGRFRQITSRIVMKLTGSDGETSSNILNYPDPHHRIFQSGSQDMIVVTTEKSLGEIQNIELWHDSHGVKPTWYCKDIVIHDIQTREKWVFKINQSLSVRHKKHKIKITPIKKSTRSNLGLSRERNVWNIFSEDIRHFTPFSHRLILVYSKLLTLLMIITVWHGLPSMDDLDMIDPYSNYFDGYLAAIIFGSSFISFLIHAVHIWWKSTYMLYFTITLILLSNNLLIIYGFWIPLCSSIRIILAWVLGVLLDIFIYDITLEEVKKLVYGTKLLDSIRGISLDDIKNEIDVQRETLHQMFESMFISKLQQMAMPLKGKKFRHRQREDKIRTMLAQQLKDLVMFGIYLILLHIVVSIEKDRLVYREHDVLMDQFRGILTRNDEIYQIEHLSDIYNYLNTTIIDTIHAPEWYHNFIDGEPGILIDRSNKYIGVARIRQHRVVETTCDVDFIPENITCGPEFSGQHEERRTFEDGWDVSTSYIPIQKRLSSMWMYSFAATTGSSYYRGMFSVYPGSGYIVNLGRTKYNSMANLDVIMDTTWIDRFTRSVFIEFLIYSANCNLFNSVRIIIERSATGLMNSRVEISPARMIYVGSELERKSFWTLIVFVIWLVFLFLNKTKLIMREGLSYLKNFWSLLDLVIIIVSICAIIIFVQRMNSIGQLLSTIEKVEHNQFVNYFGFFDVHLALNVICSILVCISTIRVWKLVRFFKMFRMFEKTLLLIMSPLLALFLHHIIFVFMYTIVTHVVFGQNESEFESYDTALTSLGNLYFSFYSKFNASNFRSIIPGLGVTLIVTYIIVSKIFLAIYVVISISSHINTRESFSQHHVDSYSFLDYIREELMFLFSWFRPRVTHHKERPMKSVIYPKPDKYMYANCIATTTHEINSMTAVGAVVLYNELDERDTKSELGEAEIQRMVKVCHFILAQHAPDDRTEFFYKVRQGNTLKIIDAKRIDKAKLVAEVLLGVATKQATRQKINRMAVLRHSMRELDRAQNKLEVCLQSLNNIEFVDVNPE